MNTWCSILLACLLAAGADAPDPRADFAMLFGRRVKEVSATTDPADDLALAKLIISSVDKLEGRAALKILMYRGAAALAARSPEGIDTALAAIAGLNRIAPARGDEWMDEKVTILQRHYERSTGANRKKAGTRLLKQLVLTGDAKLSAGDADRSLALYKRARTLAGIIGVGGIEEFNQRIATATAAAAAGEKMKKLRAAIEENPADTATRERVVMVYLLERDDPVSAKKLLTEDVDEFLRLVVATAAKPVAALAPDECREMAEWYRAQIENNKAALRQAVAARRVRDYYTAVLPAVKGVDKLKARLHIQSAEKLLEKHTSIPLPARKTAAGGGKPAGAALEKKRTVTIGDAKLALVLIPAGTFRMGDAGAAVSSPVHEVTITRPFYLGACEVTQRQWEAVTGKNPSRFTGNDHPVESVTWDECRGFIAQLNEKFAPKDLRFRLPTEAEWEYACRAGTTTTWCFGDDAEKLGDYAWYRSNAGGRSHPVGRKKPNAWGLYDVHGNVVEMCADRYGPTYYAASPKQDPPGPETGTHRVIRGGGWMGLPDITGSAVRRYVGATRDYRYGLRLAATVVR